MEKALGGTTMRTVNRLSGFTLIELMVVVIIIAAIAAMVVPNYIGMVNDSKINLAKGDIRNIDLVLRQYKLVTGKYPATADGLDVLLKPVSAGKEPLLEKQALDPWKRVYKYVYPGSHRTYSFDLWSSGPDGQDGTEDDVTNWSND